MATFPHRLTSIIEERNRVAPRARGAPVWTGIVASSDGMLGDASHAASQSDHNPDSRGVVHACDVSQSMPGTPYWDPRCQQFDVFAHIHRIIDDYRRLDAAGRARRYPWLVPGGAPNDGGYMVWYEASMGVEAIFHPGAGNLDIRSNGGHVGHTEHGHFSIGYNAASENDTQPIFGGTQPQGDEVTDADMQRLVKELGPVIVEACNKAIKHEFGGYKNGKFVEGLMLERLRAQLGASQ